jgi:hypothetical protein
MGILQCRDTSSQTPSKHKNYDIMEIKNSGCLPPTEPIIVADGSRDVAYVVKGHVPLDLKNSELEEEARDTVASKPVEIPKKTQGFRSTEPNISDLLVANSFPTSKRVNGKHKRKNSAPSMLSIYYSTSDDVKEQAIKVDESLLEDLLSLKPRTKSLSLLFQFRRKSSNVVNNKPEITEKPVKKVRFDDNVIIHRIEASPGIPPAMPETYKLVVTLREVWTRLDEDKDKHLNITELRGFCSEVWEEPDSDVYDIMKLYAKDDPDKGINFNEWCSLIKDEDPELQELVEDLYIIFLESSDSE